MFGSSALIFGGLCIAWTCIILGLSFMSGEMSSKLSKNFVAHTGNKYFNIQNTKWIHYYLRRTCHSIEFFVLEFLLLLGFYNHIKTKVISLIIAVVIAITDETVKIFVKGRHFSFEDIGLDLIGVFLALGLYNLIG